MCEITDKKSLDIFVNDLSNLQKTFLEIKNALDSLIYEIDYELTRRENSGINFFNNPTDEIGKSFDYCSMCFNTFEQCVSRIKIRLYAIYVANQ